MDQLRAAHTCIQANTYMRNKNFLKVHGDGLQRWLGSYSGCYRNKRIGVQISRNPNRYKVGVAAHL